MQVEVSCTANGITGSPPAAMQTTLQNWPCTGGGTIYNQYPWYNSTLNIPDLCSDGCVSGELYNDVFIPFSSLSPGTTIYFKAREWVGASNSPGPFSSTYSVVVPGTSTSVPLNYSLSASAYTICPSITTTLSVTNVVGGPITNYSWTPNSGSDSVIVISPSASTDYTINAFTDACTSLTQTIAITVIPTQPATFIPINPIICSANNIIFSAIGGSVLATHAWDIVPNTGYTVNNSTITPTPDITFNSVGTYVVTHTTLVNGCAEMASTTVSVNICTGINEIENSNFSIYPNPSLNGIFQIDLNGIESKDIKIEVIDVIGKTVLTETNVTNHSFTIPYIRGIYTLKITLNDKECRYKKLLIE
jgi:hypothetical protein